MKVTSLVTGGAGFIGSHVVQHLVRQGHQVVILDDLSGGNKDNVSAGAVLHIGSIVDTTLVDELFAKYQFDYVYHLAAYAAEGLSHFVRKFNYENNVIGSINLINAAVNHDVKCFVFTSSIAVYGSQPPPLHEYQLPRPEDPYGIAKYTIEMDLANAREMFGLNYVIFRPHNVYGPGQNIADKYRNVIGIFMNQALQNQPLTIFGDGQQTRAFSYINDVAPYIAEAVNIQKAYNEVFNIGSDKPVSVAEIASAVADVMEVTLNTSLLPQRREVVHAYANHDKFKQLFTPAESTSLVEGLNQMAIWVKEHGSKPTPLFKNIEINKNLPESWK